MAGTGPGGMIGGEAANRILMEVMQDGIIADPNDTPEERTYRDTIEAFRAEMAVTGGIIDAPHELP